MTPDDVGTGLPLATLAVLEEDGRLQLSIKVPDGLGERELGPLFMKERGNILGVQQSLRDTLDNFKNQCREKDLDGGVSWSALNDAFADLHRDGLGFVDEIFGNQSKLLAQRLKDVGTGWQNPATWGRTLQIESTRDLLLPWEFLPMLELREPPRFMARGDYAALEENAARFLGFPFFVRRRIRNVETVSARLSRRGDRAVLCSAAPVRLHLFLHGGLKGALQEAARLARHAPRLKVVDVEPPKTLDLSTKAARRAAVANLCDLILAFGARPDDQTPRPLTASHLMHFACHAFTEEGKNFRIELQAPAFRGQSMPRLVFDFKDLGGAAVRSYFVEHSDAAPDPPLVFMNACGGSAVEPLTARSLPAFFLDKGFLGFVGTETVVPDRFADDFSNAFYQQFLHEVPLGRALALARLTMLRRQRNPLGLLYTAYADGALYASDEAEDGQATDDEDAPGATVPTADEGGDR